MQGQLGVRGLKDRTTPTLVSALHGEKVTDVACGREHAFALIEVSHCSRACLKGINSPVSLKISAILQGGKKVYGWGCNAEGQLGLRAAEIVELPQLLQGRFPRHNELYPCAPFTPVNFEE